MNTSQQIMTFIILVLLVILGGWALMHYPRDARGPAIDISATSSAVTLPLATTSTATISESRAGIAATIHMTFPLAGSVVESPLVITGEAKGNWFFEASAPVALTEADGQVIATGYIEAKSDWMTTDFVPFVGHLSFTSPGYGVSGFLVMSNDNPSGEPERAYSIKIPVKFK